MEKQWTENVRLPARGQKNLNTDLTYFTYASGILSVQFGQSFTKSFYASGYWNWLFVFSREGSDDDGAVVQGASRHRLGPRGLQSEGLVARGGTHGLRAVSVGQ